VSHCASSVRDFIVKRSYRRISSRRIWRPIMPTVLRLTSKRYTRRS